LFFVSNNKKEKIEVEINSSNNKDNNNNNNNKDNKSNKDNKRETVFCTEY